jgi:hypothetical protein
MPNMLKRGQEFLADKQETHTSEMITYHSGAESFGPFAAVMGRADMDQSEDGNAESISTIFDFIFRASLVPRPPKSGDRITHDGQLYELIEDISGGPWRYSDPYRLRYRVHTQRLGTDD